MFTGIIAHLGIIQQNSKGTLVIKADHNMLDKLTDGMSVSVDGICLTVIGKTSDSFTINYMPETAKHTNIQYLQIGDKVNLELPATSETFLAGHIVQGHVDAVATITSIEEQGNSQVLMFSIPKEVSKYIVEKGSIAVNGISLTIISVTDDSFSVGIIPHTWKVTMLHQVKIGEKVNIEVDVLAKYVEKLLSR